MDNSNILRVVMTYQDARRFVLVNKTDPINTVKDKISDIFNIQFDANLIIWHPILNTPITDSMSIFMNDELQIKTLDQNCIPSQVQNENNHSQQANIAVISSHRSSLNHFIVNEETNQQ